MVKKICLLCLLQIITNLLSAEGFFENFFLSIVTYNFEYGMDTADVDPYSYGSVSPSNFRGWEFSGGNQWLMVGMTLVDISPEVCYLVPVKLTVPVFQQSMNNILIMGLFLSAEYRFLSFGGNITEMSFDITRHILVPKLSFMVNIANIFYLEPYIGTKINMDMNTFPIRTVIRDISIGINAHVFSWFYWSAGENNE